MEFSRRTALAGGAAAVAAACSARQTGQISESNIPMDEALVSVEAFDPLFFDVIAPKPVARMLGRGFTWAEGPAWDAQRAALYFTDVPANLAYRWHAETGTQVFLDPSGVDPAKSAGMREPGANGLLLRNDGKLLVCNHGRRAVEEMDLDTGARKTLAQEYGGQRFNSPNDVAEAADGTIYFTDPPYGLEGLNASPLKEMSVNGVYRLSAAGDLSLIIDDMTFPNGAVLSPSQDALYVSQSDPAAPLIRKWHPESSKKGEVWFDAAPFMEGHDGLPDGMAVSDAGHVFLAGPGGVLVIDQNARCLGRIGTGRASANCTFGEDGRTLFITAKDRLIAVRTKIRGWGRFAG